MNDFESYDDWESYALANGVSQQEAVDTWEKFNYRIQDNQVVHEVTATFTQYPIKLAWAVTIHKSQGQTFENVILNLDTGSFAHGQTYVALSRVVSLEGLYLTRRIKMSDVIFNQNLQEYLV